ncbi:MAG: hypothetical protein K0U59_05075 [Gammaproteobacteria bacterium]|nr:hypothetical protein [Gammaproteobacteria bacterium]
MNENIKNNSNVVEQNIFDGFRLLFGLEVGLGGYTFKKTMAIDQKLGILGACVND